MIGHREVDRISGGWAVHRDAFREFLSLLPNGLRRLTTSVMALFRSCCTVAYVPIAVAKCPGTPSHMRLIESGIRTPPMIVKAAMLHSPLKLFAPISVTPFLAGLVYYGYTFATEHRLTNMSTLWPSASVAIILTGLVPKRTTSSMCSRHD